MTLGLAAALVAVLAAAPIAAQETSPTPSPTPEAESPAPPAPSPTPAASAPAPPEPAPVVSPAAAEAPTPAPTQVPTPVPTPTPAPVLPTAQRLVEQPVISLSRLPSENPYGVAAEEPAGLPVKPVLTEAIVPASLFAAVRVDPTGKVMQSRIARDPMPSLAVESKRSFERWSFDPAARGGKPVDSWAAVRLDMQVEVRAPRVDPPALTPITPATAIPVPFEWGADTAWYDAVKAAPLSDGTVPLEQVDTPPVPKKTKWSADSFKGPFSCRFWVKVNAAGRIEKSVPIQVSDPILIAYMRRQFPAWQLRAAHAKGQPVDSWNEIAISGQIAYSIEVKQIGNLRKTLP